MTKDELVDVCNALHDDTVDLSLQLDELVNYVENLKDGLATLSEEIKASKEEE